jgi:hypothetical protein
MALGFSMRTIGVEEEEEQAYSSIMLRVSADFTKPWYLTMFGCWEETIAWSASRPCISMVEIGACVNSHPGS